MRLSGQRSRIGRSTCRTILRICIGILLMIRVMGTHKVNSATITDKAQDSNRLNRLWLVLGDLDRTISNKTVGRQAWPTSSETSSQTIHPIAAPQCSISTSRVRIILRVSTISQSHLAASISIKINKIRATAQVSLEIIATTTKRFSKQETTIISSKLHLDLVIKVVEVIPTRPLEIRISLILETVIIKITTNSAKVLSSTLVKIKIRISNRAPIISSLGASNHNRISNTILSDSRSQCSISTHKTRIRIQEPFLAILDRRITNSKIKILAEVAEYLGNRMRILVVVDSFRTVVWAYLVWVRPTPDNQVHLTQCRTEWTQMEVDCSDRPCKWHHKPCQMAASDFSE